MKTYGYDQLFIIGEQGCGKTSYALLVAYEVYEDWDEALNHLFFDPAPAFEMMEDALHTRERIPLLIFDDAGIHFSKYLISINKEGFWKAMMINSLINIIRSVCCATIFTSPDDDILKELRKKSWIRGKPYMPHGKLNPDRIIRFYKRTTIATGRVFWKRFNIEDKYYLSSIPPDVREKYEKKRMTAVAEVLNTLRTIYEKYKEARELSREEKLLMTEVRKSNDIFDEYGFVREDWDK